MYGILTGDPELARSDLGSVTHYLAERTDGVSREPIPGTVTTVACFGDTETVRSAPERAAVTPDGTRATTDAEGHHWGTVCPTDGAYRDHLLERLAELSGDVRLTTVGFPGQDFCRCERCEDQFAASNRDHWADWRADQITGFVGDAADRVEGDLLVTLYPDPFPERLRDRSGQDPPALADHVDGFLVPLCGDYGTPYWVETLAGGFDRLLGDLEPSMTIQLSVEGTTAELLADVTRMVEPHCERVVYGTFPGDRGVVEDVLERRQRSPVRPD